MGWVLLFFKNIFKALLYSQHWKGRHRRSSRTVYVTRQAPVPKQGCLTWKFHVHALECSNLRVFNKRRNSHNHHHNQSRHRTFLVLQKDPFYPQQSDRYCPKWQLSGSRPRERIRLLGPYVLMDMWSSCLWLFSHHSEHGHRFLISSE